MKNKILQRSAYGTKLRFPGYNKAWKTAQLGDVCKIVSERLDPKNDSSVRCIELEHIEACTGRLLGTTTTAEIVSLKAVFRPGDVLFGKLRPYLKKFYMPSFTGVCSTEIWVLRPTNCVIDAAFLFCIIQSSLVQRSANATFGTKMPRADWDVVSATPIRFPELDEQSRISGLHQSINQTTEYLDRLIAAKREQKRGLMQQLLTGKLRFPGFTEPWKTVRLGDVLKESRLLGTTGFTAKKITVKLYGRGVYAKQEKRTGSVNTRYFKRLSGQLIYSKLDFLNGAFGIVPDELDGFESTLDMPTFDIFSSANPHWLLALVGRRDFYQRFNDGAEGGRKAKRVDPSRFFDEVIQLPCRAEQDRIARLIIILGKEIELLAQQRAAFAAQRRGLMEKLLSGEIDIQNPKETAA